MSVYVRLGQENTLLLKLGTKVQKNFDICKFLSLRKSPKFVKFYANIIKKPLLSKWFLIIGNRFLNFIV